MDEQTTPKFCYNCGKPANPGVPVCWNCSQPVQPPTAGESAPTSYSSAPLPEAPAVSFPDNFQQPSATTAPKQGGQREWRKYGSLALVGFGLLWKYKFMLFIALRSLTLFGRH